MYGLVRAIKAKSNYQFSGFPIVDERDRLAGDQLEVRKVAQLLGVVGAHPADDQVSRRVDLDHGHVVHFGHHALGGGRATDVAEADEEDGGGGLFGHSPGAMLVATAK